MQALSLTLSLRRWIACQSMAREARGRGVQVCGRGVREGDAPSPVIHLRLLAAAARERTVEGFEGRSACRLAIPSEALPVVAAAARGAAAGAVIGRCSCCVHAAPVECGQASAPWSSPSQQTLHRHSPHARLLRHRPAAACNRRRQSRRR